MEGRHGKAKLDEAGAFCTVQLQRLLFLPEGIHERHCPQNDRVGGGRVQVREACEDQAVLQGACASVGGRELLQGMREEAAILPAISAEGNMVKFIQYGMCGV